MTKRHSKVNEPWSSSITLANTMPTCTSVMNSRVVLIVRKSYFAKQVQVQVQLYREWNDNHVCIINQ